MGFMASMTRPGIEAIVERDAAIQSGEIVVVER